jgi:hypothetical protein
MALHVCILTGTLLAAPAYAIEKCESFAEVRTQIDAVVKGASPQAEKFRSEVKSGADSLYVIEQLSPPEMANKLDICRYEAVEYLVKLGFPPAH